MVNSLVGGLGVSARSFMGAEPDNLSFVARLWAERLSGVLYLRYPASGRVREVPLRSGGLVDPSQARQIRVALRSCVLTFTPQPVQGGAHRRELAEALFAGALSNADADVPMAAEDVTFSLTYGLGPLTELTLSYPADGLAAAAAHSVSVGEMLQAAPRRLRAARELHALCLMGLVSLDTAEELDLSPPPRYAAFLTGALTGDPG
ncbi:MAG: hypothetical protein H6739_09195 [Alphaproteobacteria bacterium]|nr:hypothetical protein [Alphaproteobacteria bacterium]